MILSDHDILQAMDKGTIIIKPFNRPSLGSNSYDVHLGKNVLVYTDQNLDCARAPNYTLMEIGSTGMLLNPDELYLMVTQEYTETYGYVPFLEGKSSLGRLGLSIHVTAGKGDDGFKGSWTMEVTVKKPTRVYEGMPCGQIIYHTMSSPADVPYHQKTTAKYNNNDVKDGSNHMPMPSRMYQNFPKIAG